MTSDGDTEALVTGAYSRRMNLRIADGNEVVARIKGKKLRPVCGDRVIAAPIPNEPEWLISSILERRNQLTRPDSRGRVEVLAANLTCVVVMAAAEPVPDWFIVDRYIAAAEHMGCSAIVVFNKTDLDHPAGDVAETLRGYSACGYPVIECSAKSGGNIDQLADLIAGETAIIVGQSGVGKSTVINRLVGDAALRTGTVSAGSGEGRHTTVNSVMLDLPQGGTVVDSPGVRDYAPAIEKPEEVVHGFRELNEIGESCRFANCLHLREPDCAVKQAVDDGTISARRYESYRRLLALSKDLAEKKY